MSAPLSTEVLKTVAWALAFIYVMLTVLP